jgi:hypothetical protein
LTIRLEDLSWWIVSKETEEGEPDAEYGKTLEVNGARPFPRD